MLRPYLVVRSTHQPLSSLIQTLNSLYPSYHSYSSLHLLTFCHP